MRLIPSPSLVQRRGLFLCLIRNSFLHKNDYSVVTLCWHISLDDLYIIKGSTIGWSHYVFVIRMNLEAFSRLIPDPSPSPLIDLQSRFYNIHSYPQVFLPKNKSNSNLVFSHVIRKIESISGCHHHRLMIKSEVT